jgi:hypothetical protein
MLRKKYPSDLTDTQWELIEKLIEKECPYQGGTKVTLDEYKEILGVEQHPTRDLLELLFCLKTKG